MKKKANQPELFFSIGGFPNGCHCLVYSDGNLKHFMDQRDDYIPEWATTIRSTSFKKWQAFENDMLALNVWGWDKEYFDPHICDGTQWKLKLRIKGKRILNRSGSNRCPNQFSAFLTALTDLCGFDFMELPSDPIQVSRRPIKCPVCGVRPVAEIVYGLPDGPLEDDLRYTLGGCCVEFPTADWRCTNCLTFFIQHG